MSRNLTYHNIQQSEMEWIVAETYTSVVPGELVEKIRHVHAHPDLSVIKENNVRLSAFATLPKTGEIIFVKRYKSPGLMNRFKYFFFPSKASSEWKNMNRLQERDIPVPLPIAKGEKRRFRCLLDSYLVTKAIVGARPIHLYAVDHFKVVQSSDKRLEKSVLIKQLARLVQRIHDQGFFYRDLHAGNILVLQNNGGEARLYPIDFHKVWYLGKVPTWMRVRDLAQLKNSLPASKTDQLRFLREYAKTNPSFHRRFKLYARRVERKADRLWRIHLKSRTKRCLVKSSEFDVKSSRSQTLFYNKQYSEKLISDILDTYYHASASGSLGVLKKTAKEVVSAVTVNHHGKELKVLVKESNLSTFFSRLRFTFFQTRARKYWYAARGLKVRKIPTPSVLALIEKRSFGMPRQTILITEFLDRAFELNDYVRRNFKRDSLSDHAHKKERFIKAFSYMIRELHQKGIYHADLKSNNILVQEEKEGGWRFYFIDLDRVFFKNRLSFKERANNLAQINASVADCIDLSDRLQFFRYYARGTSLMNQRNRYYQTILAISRKKITQPYGITFPTPVPEK